jgi:hypothetical protein
MFRRIYGLRLTLVACLLVSPVIQELAEQLQSFSDQASRAYGRTDRPLSAIL